jgi:hypothetical protein
MLATCKSSDSLAHSVGASTGSQYYCTEQCSASTSVLDSANLHESARKCLQMIQVALLDHVLVVATKYCGKHAHGCSFMAVFNYVFPDGSWIFTKKVKKSKKSLTKSKQSHHCKTPFLGPSFEPRSSCKPSSPLLICIQMVWKLCGSSSSTCTSLTVVLLLAS